MLNRRMISFAVSHFNYDVRESKRCVEKFKYRSEANEEIIVINR